ncbi:MAG: glycosyltransferase family 39 protein [Candidatus Omnitrophica bacterium]|nr:glycosyltransferase family 39 protein [Candidatus Omnitrophota bacterium]
MTARLRLGVAVLLVFLAAQSLLTIPRKSPTSDEFSHHVASGCSYWVARDFRMNPVTPPLSRILVSFPFLFLKVKCPLDHLSWREGDSPEFARQFFYHNTLTMDELIFWARLPVVALSVLFGLVIFWVSRYFFGDLAALASLSLYSFCPTVIAFSSLATSDLPVAFFYFLGVILFGFYLRTPSWKNLCLVSVATGLALLSKFTALLLFPTLFLIALFLKKKKEIAFGRVLTFTGLVLLTVWTGYFFEVKPLLKNTPDPPKKAAFLRKVGGDPLVRFGQETPVPLATFVSSLGSFCFTRSAGTRAYLMGKWSRNGWWYYYFVAFAIKNTVPMVLLSALSLLFLKKFTRDRWIQTILIVPVIFFFIATLPDRAQAGIRYFLPIYPFFFLSGGGLVAYLYRKRGWRRWTAGGLLLWHAASALLVFPDYLSYFNESIGGSKNGYRWLRDSNLDWGQDLKGLASHARKEGYSEVALYFLGPVDPFAYGMPARSLTADEFQKPKPTVYAVGAHGMDDVLWARDARPTAVIGHSIFVYDFRKTVSR